MSDLFLDFWTSVWKMETWNMKVEMIIGNENWKYTNICRPAGSGVRVFKHLRLTQSQAHSFPDNFTSAHYSITSSKTFRMEGVPGGEGGGGPGGVAPFWGPPHYRQRPWKRSISPKICAGGHFHTRKNSFSWKTNRRRPLPHAKTKFLTKKNRQRPLSHAKTEFKQKKKRRRPLAHAKTEFFTKNNRRRPLSHAKIKFFRKNNRRRPTSHAKTELFTKTNCRRPASHAKRAFLHTLELSSHARTHFFNVQRNCFQFAVAPLG